MMLTGGTAISFGIILLLVIAITLYPALMIKLRSQYASGDNFILQAAKVFLLVAAFMIVGPSLMVLNKEILQTLHFDFPLTLSGMGLSMTAIVTRSLVAFGFCEVRPEAREVVAGNAWYWAVLPIALAKAATLACGNAVYLHLGLGFIQMLKALNPVIVVFVMRQCGLALPPRMARWGVYMIISGTLVEVKGERYVTLIGVVLMMTSEVMEAFNLVLTQKLLHNCKFTLTEGLYFIAPPSTALLLGAAAVMEFPRLMREGSYAILAEQPIYFAGSCLLGLAVNFVGMAVVQATSSLTVKVLNTVRGIGVVFVGMLMYGEYCSSLELGGYAVALVGFTVYNFGQLSASAKTERQIER